MIISASRRTDIPTYYADWFFRRIQEGFVLVRNPMNAHQVSQVSLNPEVVDGIVFWTKNPLPMLDRLDALRDYMYYFQFTLNGYREDVERNIPSRKKVIIPAFQRLSDQIGPDRVIWRYDPILLNDTYTVDWHLRCFEELAKRLAPYTRLCTISFLDFYRNTEKNMAGLETRHFTPEIQDTLARHLAEIAHSHGLRLATCAEGIDLEQYGIEHARCVDGRLFEKLLGCPLDLKKDKNQRQECGCAESIDIGAYNTCRNGCRYCYANYNQPSVQTNSGKHNPLSPLLVGGLGPEDKVTQRAMHSCLHTQLEFPLK